MDNKNSIIVCDDGFVWKALSEEEAYKVFDSGIFELYKVYSKDWSDALITTKEEIGEALANGDFVCIDVGFHPREAKEEEKIKSAELVKKGWACTDPDFDQWCKKVDDFSYLYFEKGKGDKDTPTMIDIRDYTVREIESAINPYGYTLFKKEGNRNIYELYEDSAIQIITEYLFESGENY